MGEVVYTATVFEAFGYFFLAFIFFLLLGLSGLGVGIFRRKDRAVMRVVAGCSGLILCFAAAATAFVTFRSMTSGSETISARLNDKQVTTRKCGEDNRRTCTNYTLEIQTVSMFYDVAVGEGAYNSVDVNSCYSITYYPRRGLPGLSGKPGDSYQSIGSVTRIETAACP
jgi:hypothetical protein